jgi:hypothetical protein
MAPPGAHARPTATPLPLKAPCDAMAGDFVAAPFDQGTCIKVKKPAKKISKKHRKKIRKKFLTKTNFFCLFSFKPAPFFPLPLPKKQKQNLLI